MESLCGSAALHSLHLSSVEHEQEERTLESERTWTSKEEASLEPVRHRHHRISPHPRLTGLGLRPRTASSGPQFVHASS